VEADEQVTAPRRPQQTAELLAELDTLLLEFRRRLDAYVESGSDDIVAADEGVRVATLVQSAADAAARHAGEIAATLERSHGIRDD